MQSHLAAFARAATSRWMEGVCAIAIHNRTRFVLTIVAQR